MGRGQKGSCNSYRSMVGDDTIPDIFLHARISGTADKLVAPQIEVSQFSKMKILLGVHQFFPDRRAGTEVLTLELARGLRARGHHVEIIAGEADHELSAECQPRLSHDSFDEFVVHRLRYGMTKRKHPIADHWFEPRRVQVVLDLVRSLKPDVVHFNHVMGFSAQILQEVSQLGLPVFFTATDYWIVCPKHTLFRTFDKRVCSGPGDGVNCARCFCPIPRWLAKTAAVVADSPISRLSSMLRNVNSIRVRVDRMVKALGKVSRILVSTQFLAQVLIDHGVEKEMIRVIPYGVDIGVLPEKRAVPNEFSASDPLRLGYIGTISKIKGPHLILRAIEFLGEQRKLVRLEIFGKTENTDPFCRWLLKEVRNRGLPVEFKGTFPHEMIGKILRGFHLLVIPSLWYESAPLVLCSALAAGTPVVVSRLGGMTEALQEGENGISFTPGDYRALFGIISDFLRDPTKLRDMHLVMNAQIRTPADYVSEIEEEYCKALAESHRPS